MSTIKVDTITDEAGTGAPTFSQGAVVTGNLSATGTIAGGVFSGSGAGLTGIDAFKPVAVTGTTPSLDVGSYNFFNSGTLTADTTVSFTNVPTNANWKYTFQGGVETGYVLSTGNVSNTLNVATQAPSIREVRFKSDGTKMYVLCALNKTVYQYTLTKPFSTEVATYDNKSVYIGGEATGPRGLDFKTDGTAMYVACHSTDKIYQYALSTAWDVSTATFTNKEVSVTATLTEVQAITFKPDGTSMYACGPTDIEIRQYTLSTAWDVSTASYANKTKSTSSEDTLPKGIQFNNDGTELFMAGDTNNAVYKYDLSTAYDVSTATFTAGNFITVSIFPDTTQGLAFDSVGSRMYIVDDNTDTVTEWRVGEYYTVTLPASLSNSITKSIYNNRVTYDFFTMDGGTTVTLIGEEIV